MEKCISIRVNGKVQGVWYRASTRNKARELGLRGIVRNERDGSVYIEVAGAELQLRQFADWCREGPPHADVREIKIEEIEMRDFENFSIER